MNRTETGEDFELIMKTSASLSVFSSLMRGRNRMHGLASPLSVIHRNIRCRLIELVIGRY